MNRHTTNSCEERAYDNESAITRKGKFLLKALKHNNIDLIC